MLPRIVLALAILAIPTLAEAKASQSVGSRGVSHGKGGGNPTIVNPPKTPTPKASRSGDRQGKGGSIGCALPGCQNPIEGFRHGTVEILKSTCGESCANRGDHPKLRAWRDEMPSTRSHRFDVCRILATAQQLSCAGIQ